LKTLILTSGTFGRTFSCYQDLIL